MESFANSLMSAGICENDAQKVANIFAEVDPLRPRTATEQSFVYKVWATLINPLPNFDEQSDIEWLAAHELQSRREYYESCGKW